MIGSSGDAAYVPILPSFDKFFNETEKASAKAGKQAGAKFADEMERSVQKAQKAVDTAAKAQERAHNRAADAADKTRIAQIKLNETLEKGTATQSQIAKATADYEKAQRDEASAKRAAEKATSDYEKAQAGLKKATDEAANSVALGADETKKFGDAADDASEKNTGFELSFKNVALAATAIVGSLAAAGKAAYELGASFDEAYDTIRAGTGASGEAFEGLKNSMRNVARDSIGVGDDLGEIGTTLADLNTRLGLTGAPLETLTTQFQQLKNIGFEADINAVTGAFTQFGVAAEDMPGQLDALFQISQATGRGMDELVNNLTKSGPALQNFGFDLTESAGLLGALDKAGLDADKTMQSMTKALSEIAKEGKDPQAELWGMIAKIDDLTRAGKNAEAVDLANSIFGARGGTGFVAAVQSGAFAYDDFMESIGGSGDTINSVAEETASFSEKWDQFKLRAMLALEPVATKIFDSMVPAVEAMWGGIETASEKLQEFTGWIKDNQGWLTALAAGFGVLAAGIAATVLQMKIAQAGGFINWIVGATKATTAWSTATKIAAGAQMFFNNVIRANPIAMIVTAITAAVGALTVFFMKTETGQRVWASFTGFIANSLEAVKVAWKELTSAFSGGDWGFGQLAEWFGEDKALIIVNLAASVGNAFRGLKDVFVDMGAAVQLAWSTMATAIQVGWSTIILPALNAFITAGKLLFVTLTTLVITPIQLAWDAMAFGMRLAYDSVIQPMLNAFAAAGQWLYNNVLLPNFLAIQAAWSALGVAIQWVRDTIIQPVFDAVAAGITWLHQNVVVPATDGMRWAWEQMGNAFAWVRDSIIQPAFDAVGAGLNWLNDNVVVPVTNFMRSTWEAMGYAFDSVKNFIVDTVFGGFKSGLDTLQGWVATGVDAMGRLWDGLKRKFAEPINFVIRVVYNDGIKKVFDGVAEKVGLDARLPNVETIGGYARGGQLPGYTPGRDIYDFYSPQGLHIGLSGGEGILVPEAQRALGKKRLEELNDAARRGGVRGAATYLEHLGHFARGGEVPSLGGFAKGGFINAAGGLTPVTASHAKFVSRFFPGIFTLTSALRFTDNGYHSKGMATDWSNGGNAGTPEMKQLALAIAKNFPNTTQLIHWPLHGWTNILNGGPFDYGPGTNNEHRNHVHWATTSPLQFNGDDIVLDDVPAAGGGMSFNPVDWFKSFASGIMDKLPKFDLPGFGDWAKVPGAAGEKMFGMVKDWALGKLKEWGKKFLNFIGLGGHIDSGQLADMATEALKRMGYGPEHLNAMLQQIQIESGGDPNAVNNWDINAKNGVPSGGLLQVIEPTYRDVRRRWPEAFEGLPDDRMHPMTNLVAGVGAVKRDWGGPAGRWPTRGGYATGGVLPGYTPGRDVHQFWSPTAGWLGLSGGEAIMVPEWTRAMGGPKAIDAMNRAARHGGGATVEGGNTFAGGGVWRAPSGGGDVLAQFQAAVASLSGAADEIHTAFSGGDYGYGDLARVLRNEEWAKAIVDGAYHLGRMADPYSDEGVFGRAVAGKGATILDMLGLDTPANITTTLLNAEKGLLDARADHAGRLEDIASKEKELENLRRELAKLNGENVELSVQEQRKLADAEKALADARKAAGEETKKEAKDAESAAKAKESANEKVKQAEEKLERVKEDIGLKQEEDAEKRAEKVTDLTEKIATAELNLATARRASIAALDMSLYSVLPQLNHGLNGMARQLQQVTPQIMGFVNANLPQAAGVAASTLSQATGALTGLAAAAGPAGVSVGVAVAGLISVIQVGKMIVETADKFIGRAVEGRKAFAGALGDFTSGIRELLDLTEQQRQLVSKLRMDLVRQTIAQTKSMMDSRNANADLVRARLEGDKTVADARAALDAEMRAEARRNAVAYGDLSLAYGRYRHNEVAGMRERLEAQREITPEIRALMYEVDAAEMQRAANMNRAAVAAMKASHAQGEAARAALRTTQDLETAAKRLADMTGTAFGMDRAGAHVGQEIARLYAENAEIEGRLKSWGNALSINYNTRVRKSDEKALARNEARIRELQAMPEYQGFGVADSELKRLAKDAAKLYMWGKGDQAEVLLKNSVLGDPRRAAEAFKFQQGLDAIKDEARDLSRAVEDFESEISLDKSIRQFEDSANALDSAAKAAKLHAESLRSEDVEVAFRLNQLAKFEEANAVDIQRVSRGEPSKIELSFTDKAAYSAAEVDEILAKLGDVSEHELRISKLERDTIPTATDLMRARR